MSPLICAQTYRVTGDLNRREYSRHDSEAAAIYVARALSRLWGDVIDGSEPYVEQLLPTKGWVFRCRIKAGKQSG